MEAGVDHQVAGLRVVRVLDHALMMVEEAQRVAGHVRVAAQDAAMVPDVAQLGVLARREAVLVVLVAGALAGVGRRALAAVLRAAVAALAEAAGAVAAHVRRRLATLQAGIQPVVAHSGVGLVVQEALLVIDEAELLTGRVGQTAQHAAMMLHPAQAWIGRGLLAVEVGGVARLEAGIGRRGRRAPVLEAGVDQGLAGAQQAAQVGEVAAAGLRALDDLHEALHGVGRGVGRDAAQRAPGVAGVTTQGERAAEQQVPAGPAPVGRRRWGRRRGLSTVVVQAGLDLLAAQAVEALRLFGLGQVYAAMGDDAVHGLLVEREGRGVGQLNAGLLTARVAAAAAEALVELEAPQRFGPTGPLVRHAVAVVVEPVAELGAGGAGLAIVHQDAAVTHQRAQRGARALPALDGLGRDAVGDAVAVVVEPVAELGGRRAWLAAVHEHAVDAADRAGGRAEPNPAGAGHRRDLVHDPVAVVVDAIAHLGADQVVPMAQVPWHGPFADLDDARPIP